MLVVRKSRDVVVESRDVVVESRDLFVESRDRSRGISRLSRDYSWILETFLEIPRLPVMKISRFHDYVSRKREIKING